MRITAFFLIITLSVSLCSTIINIPDDYSTIQEGINVAVNGDTVLVADGTYTGAFNRELTWDGNEKHLTIKSENGPEYSLIDCQNSGRAFSFIETNQDSTDRIEGFTLINGYISAGWEVYGGGSICCYNASPIIINNIIRNNTVDEANGGAIFLYNSNSKVIGNNIKHNIATYSGFPGACSGGGIYINSGSVVIKDNTIKNNHTISIDHESSAMGGGIFAYSAEVIIANNLIYNNGAHSGGFGSIGGGISLVYCTNESKIINNTIFYNFAENGSGINCNRGQISQNIIVYNTHDGLRCNWPTHTALIEHNNVWGNQINYVNCSPEIGNTSWGFNSNGTACDSCFNISEDPFFVLNQNGDFFLSQIEAGQNAQSPCVNAGSGLPINYNLENYTTRTDLIYDEGIVDIGFHYLGFSPQNMDDEYIIKPFKYQLSNYPNPFNPSTTISFNLTTEIFEDIELIIYNIKGQKIRQFSIFNNKSSIVWDGRDSNNKQVSSGIYFYKLKTDDFQQTKKMMLIK